MAPGQQSPGITTPALSEQADTIALEPQFQNGPGQGGFQFSLTASGHHYIRDGTGNETLYDLSNDRFERHNLMAHSQGGQAVGVLRNMLLDVLTETPARSRPKQRTWGITGKGSRPRSERDQRGRSPPGTEVAACRLRVVTGWSADNRTGHPFENLVVASSSNKATR